MQIILRFLILSATLCSATSAAELYSPHHPNPIVESWRWRSFPDMQGRELLCLAEDNEGQMWFGTEDGLWRYDGTTWTAYGAAQGLLGRGVVTVAVSSDNHVYCGTEMGIYRLEGDTWSPVLPDKLPWFVSDLAVDPLGGLWATTGWGLVRFSEDGVTLHGKEALQGLFPSLQFHPLPSVFERTPPVSYGALGIERLDQTVVWVIPASPADSAGIQPGDRVLETTAGESDYRLTLERDGVRSVVTIHPRSDIGEGGFQAHDVLLSRDGSIWISTNDGVIARRSSQDGKWTLYGPADGLNTGALPRMLETSAGEIWTASDDRFAGINRFDGRRWTSEWLSAVGGIDVNPSLVQTRDGTIWVGGHEGVLHAFRNGTWEIYRSPIVPLPTTRIVDLLETTDGALWIACRGREPLRLDHGASRWWTLHDLNFQCEDTEGELWFLEVGNGVVRLKDRVWTRYSTDDGLMDAPTGLTATSTGDVVATGSDDRTAATAIFRNETWGLVSYPALSWGIDARATFEDSDGALWLGAAVDWDAALGHRGGVIRWDETEQTHYTPPDVLRYIYGIGQTADGRVWIGSRRGLHHFDGEKWMRVNSPEVLTSRIDAVHSTSSGDLWIGHRARGVFHFDGSEWDSSDVRHGLADNTVRSILHTHDGSVWAVSDRGTSRFDGRTWTTPALSDELRLGPRGSLQQTRDGTLWINTASEDWHRRAWPLAQTDRTRPTTFQTVRYRPDRISPETTIAFAQGKVSQPGNTTLSWRGADPWGETQAGDLLFAWRLDDEPWSPYTSETSHIYQELVSGDHRFEVRARDRDFNVDLTPASILFSVTPPVWQQTWFITLVLFFTGAVTIQTVRVIRRDRELHRSNEALQERNTELAQSNRDLEETRDQLVMSEKMASLGNLVAGVAHEINNPIGAFNSAADTLKRCIERVTEAVTQSHSVEEIRQNRQYQRAVMLINDTTDNAVAAGGRVTRIVESLKNFAHLDEANYQQTDLHASLDSMIILRDHDLGERISIVRSYGDIPLVTCYASELNQVFMNIFNNAIEAIENRGEITIATATGGNEVTITFADTGSGIPADALDRIFDPGFTTKGVGVGVGLGLSTAYRIVQKHGGRIDVNSEEGKGSTFTLTLPIVAKGETDG